MKKIQKLILLLGLILFILMGLFLPYRTLYETGIGGNKFVKLEYAPIFQPPHNKDYTTIRIRSSKFVKDVELYENLLLAEHPIRLYNFKYVYPEYTNWSDEKILSGMKNAYPQFKTWNDTILAYAFEYASTPIDGDIASIDLQRLFLQWCMLVIFIGSIVLVLREKKNHEA